MNLPACMDQAGIIDSDDSNIEQARGLEPADIVKAGMMERAECQVVAILEHRTLDRAHTAAGIGDRKLLSGGTHAAAAFGHNLGRHLIGHIGRKRAGTLAIAEDMHARKAHATAQRQRLLELLVRLAGEADDDVARK